MFAIDLEDIDQVLLPDGWHRVLNHSFTIGTCQIGQPRTRPTKSPTGRMLPVGRNIRATLPNTYAV